MAERCFFKIEQKDCDLFKKVSEFLDMEEELRETQKKAIESQLPKFSMYQGQRGFTRIVRYTGFVFDDKENIDPKVWKTKEIDGKMLSTPNLRTKAGRAMNEFLQSFKRTTCWDVDRLLKIDRKSVHGKFYPPNLFRHNGCIYIIIDSQYCSVFAENNADAIEITYGEINKAIDAYNAQCK